MLFSPIIAVISVYGIIHVKQYISKYSEKINLFIPFILLFISILYTIFKINFSTPINPWYVYVFSLIGVILLIAILFCNKLRGNFSTLSVKLVKKIKPQFYSIIIIFSMLIFSITSIETNRAGMSNSEYPWENTYLTNEEIEIIDFFQTKEINGFIFTVGVSANHFYGGGFLPAFYDKENIGLALWYEIVYPDYIRANTKFSLIDWYSFNFFNFHPTNSTWQSNNNNPLRVLNIKIRQINISNQDENLSLRIEYNIQYIISIKEQYLDNTMGWRNWTLIQSLQQSTLEPTFSTQHLLVWKI